MTHFGKALREPCGRIHWAGWEPSVEWPGYIEGALRSGRAPPTKWPRSTIPDV